MYQSENELTRTQLIAKVEAEVDRFQWASGTVSDLELEEPTHKHRMDCDFSAFPSDDEPTKVLTRLSAKNDELLSTPRSGFWSELTARCLPYFEGARRAMRGLLTDE
jgi:hypothetical protein